jgi:hypothetical protein
MPRRLFVAVVLATLAAAQARSFVLGGGTADKDCRVAFGGLDATAGASGVVCADGDPVCDTDGSADGACTFRRKVLFQPELESIAYLLGKPDASLPKQNSEVEARWLHCGGLALRR